ncbi:hypothetical protein, partial [Asanoa sp. NPDC050611]|uniref:hypothetical protein n=1 Tax=Asanoa sp. NPDC050611 TaxID=3157098 RepID=UPI0033F8909E
MRGRGFAVVELVPKMVPEAPDGYVSFVDRHLAALRLESARLAGDAWRAEEIYPEVLTDVAARWPWLELLARRFGRSAAADDYLHQTLANRAKRWRAEQIYEVEMVVLRADPAEAATEPGGPAPRPILGDTASDRRGIAMVETHAARALPVPSGGAQPSTAVPLSGAQFGLPVPFGRDERSAGVPLGRGERSAGVPLGRGERSAGVPLGRGERSAGVPLGRGERSAGVPLGRGERSAGVPLGRGERSAGVP